MSTSKHTPGPWDVVALNGFGPFAIRMPTPVGTKWPTHYGVGQVGTIENAHLIAAAPDLLEALIGLFQSYKTLADSGDAGNWRIEDFPEGKAALEAIAKAEGGK